jgi:hypothetical protein
MYWSAEEIIPNPYEIIQNNHYMMSRHDYTNLQHAVMATSYALQLYLQHNDMANALPIMKWLVAQHNGFMAWSSTQVREKILLVCSFFLMLHRKIFCSSDFECVPVASKYSPNPCLKRIQFSLVLPASFNSDGVVYAPS